MQRTKKEKDRIDGGGEGIYRNPLYFVSTYFYENFTAVYEDSNSSITCLHCYCSFFFIITILVNIKWYLTLLFPCLW